MMLRLPFARRHHYAEAVAGIDKNPVKIRLRLIRLTEPIKLSNTTAF